MSISELSSTAVKPAFNKKNKKLFMPPHVRFLAHASCLLAVIFLAFYAGAVCPFIDSLPLSQVLYGLLAVAVAHVIYRETLFRILLSSKNHIDLTKRHYIASISSWIMAGATASALHATLYIDFPLASHLKLLIGYWALGGGFAALVESLYFTNRTRSMRYNSNYGSFTGQFLRMFAIFSLVPSMVIILIIVRFADEGFINAGAGVEIGFLVTIFSVVSIVIGYYYGLGLKKDTSKLVGVLGKIEKGNFLSKIDETRPDELGYVAKQLNVMSLGLKNKDLIQNAFGRFVNPHVANKFIKEIEKDGKIDLAGSTKNLAILMCDLRGFSKLTENMEPKKITDFLNHYFSGMVSVIHENNGIVDKFIGDAVMAVFGLTDKDEKTVVANAVKAGEMMIERMGLINEENHKGNRPVLVNGVGISYGETVAGYIGSKERLEYTVIGATVNMASRLESLSHPPNPRLILSDSIANVLKKSGQEVVALGEEKIKGFNNKVAIFTTPKMFSSAKKSK